MLSIWGKNLQSGAGCNRLFAFAATISILMVADPTMAQTVADLQRLSIDDLATIQVTSVSKSAQPLADAAAAVYVITHDDIMRSGAQNLPEILRLAPNLQVAQMTANSWAITARGFNGNAADKLLVLIDGRSVYTPLYGGVLWDELGVLPEDIERIEVISGPGATLWGANAVNGVINIITRKSAATQGGVLDLSAGNRGNQGSLQYGGTLEDDLRYRAYVDTFTTPSDKTSTGANAEDGWSKTQGGFRLDWTPQSDTVTVQGDMYRGSEDATPTLNTNISGLDLQTTWQHQLDDGSSLQILAYYDGTRRFVDGLGYSLNTYDLELQHSFTPWQGNDIVWGAGYRAYQDDFQLVGALQFLPASRVESLSDIFAQDTISLDASLKLILGMKLEDDPYSGIAPLPNARLSWKFADNALLWAAVSRAVRAPTRFDTDLQDTIIPGILILEGNKDFQSEKLDAFEIGTRLQPTDAMTLSVSTFYNIYNDLRSIEWANMTTLPLLWTYGNMMEGHTYGVEVWGDYQVLDWWKLSAGFNVQHEALSFKSGSSALGGVASAGDDPNHQASLRSSMRLGNDVTWEADFRYVGALPDPAIPAYVEVNSKLSWNITQSLELAVSGLNLLQAHHLEYEEAGATTGDEVDRGFYVETKIRF